MTRQDALLACGILYAGSYVVANDAVAASICPSYSRTNQAVSELSAKGAPSRPFLVGMSALWTPAMIAFGVGVQHAARDNRALRTTAALLVASGVTSVGWLPFPMTAREEMVPGTTAANDIGHLAMSAVTTSLILAQIASGAAARGRKFRLYSVVTAATVLVCGGLLAHVAPNLPRGRATPRMGLYERAAIGAWLLWMSILAVALMRQDRKR